MTTLHSPYHIKTDYDRRSFTDERRKIDYHVYEYRGSDGEDYRKAFETPRDVPPQVPESGTHEQINAVKIQWR